MILLGSHSTVRGMIVEIAWKERGFCVDFARNLCGVCEERNPFFFKRERDGYKRRADCTV